MNSFKDAFIRGIAGIDQLRAIDRIIFYTERDGGGQGFVVMIQDVNTDFENNSVVFTGKFTATSQVNFKSVYLYAGNEPYAMQNVDIRLNSDDEMLINWIIKVD